MKNFFKVPELDLIEVRNYSAFKSLKVLVLLVPIISAICLSVFFWSQHVSQFVISILVSAYFFLSLALAWLGRKLLDVLVRDFEFSLNQVKESKEHFRLLANSIPELVSVATGEGRPLWYSDAWYRYTGSSPQGNTGVINWEHVHHPDHFPKVLEKWKIGLDEQKPFEIQFPLRGKDGTYRRFHYRATPVTDQNNNVLYWFGTCDDIEAEVTKSEEEKFLKDATSDLNSSLEIDGILSVLSVYTVPNLVDCVATVLFENEDPGKITHQNVSPQKDELGIGPMHAQQLKNILAKVNWDLIREKKLQIIDDINRGVSCLQPQGFNSFAVIPMVALGKLKGVYLLFLKRDKEFDLGRGKILTKVTDLCTQALNNADLHLASKEAVESRDEFISIASHELKTPLTSLLLQIQMLERQVKPESVVGTKVVESIMFCRKQTNKLSDLVNQLLDVTQIRMGKLQLRKLQMDLTVQIDEACNRFETQAHAKGISLGWTRKSPVLGFWDPIRIEQIISNLISNALKYGDGKPISIELELLDNQKEVKFSVKDQGCGIPKDMHEKIFDRFARVGVDTDGIRGLGLGLFICKQLVQAHSGKIEVKSTIGQGSEFIVTLPLS